MQWICMNFFIYSFPKRGSFLNNAFFTIKWNTHSHGQRLHRGKLMLWWTQNNNARQANSSSMHGYTKTENNRIITITTTLTSKIEESWLSLRNSYYMHKISLSVAFFECWKWHVGFNCGHWLKWDAACDFGKLIGIPVGAKSAGKDHSYWMMNMLFDLVFDQA